VRTIYRTLIGLTATSALLIALASPAFAQAPPPPSGQAPPAQAQVRSPIEGDLVSVDPDAKRLTVKPATGANIVFMYTDATEISGAQKDAAGLATLKEGKVTVHFTEDAQSKAKTATRIIVQAKQ
jgi:hypothetical protein